MKLIGISGKKRRGKDTAARVIQAAFPPGTEYPAALASFAGAVKRQVAEACGVTEEFMEQHRAVFRPIWQWWGTDFRRNLFSESYWIDLAAELAEARHQVGTATVFTDVRFPNEYAYIKEHGGIVVRIESARAECAGDDAHPSETALDGFTFDYTLRNDGSLQKFEQDVGRFAETAIAQYLGVFSPTKKTRNP